MLVHRRVIKKEVLDILNEEGRNKLLSQEALDGVEAVSVLFPAKTWKDNWISKSADIVGSAGKIQPNGDVHIDFELMENVHE